MRARWLVPGIVFCSVIGCGGGGGGSGGGQSTSAGWSSTTGGSASGGGNTASTTAGNGGSASGGGNTAGNGATSAGFGTGSGGSPGGVVSCTISEEAGSASACTDIAVKICEEAPSSYASAIQTQCQQSTVGDAGLTAALSFVNGPCSHVDALGGCALSEAGVIITVWYYAGIGPPSASDIMMLCSTAGATYVAP